MRDTQSRSSPIRPRWLVGRMPKRPCSISARGWSVPAAATGRPLWWRAGPRGPPMLGTIEMELPKAQPGERSRLQRQAEFIRELLTT
jgi:hypothetical protein